jgi:hypothetical protein
MQCEKVGAFEHHFESSPILTSECFDIKLATQIAVKFSCADVPPVLCSCMHDNNFRLILYSEMWKMWGFSAIHGNK